MAVLPIRISHIRAGRSAVTRLAPPRRRVVGRALLGYLHEPVAWRDDDPGLNGHTNKWESRQIARILRDRGLAVDAIDFRDTTFVPQGDYDVVMAIDGQLARLASAAHAQHRLLHLTGSYGPFQNAAEHERIEALAERRGLRCAPRRLVADLPGAERALEIATACSLIGNATTLASYPAWAREKITCIPVTASSLPAMAAVRDLVPARREFLWFFGSGAVHKGLDLVLEAFAELPDHVLHVVGNIQAETDFVAAYEAELGAPNIHVHGYLDAASAAFAEIVDNCVAFVAPSCSEGTSPAVVTLLQLGLYPLISRQTGVDLPPGTGRYLETSSSAEIVSSVKAVAAMESVRLGDELEILRSFARRTYSRPAFDVAMRAYVAAALEAIPAG
jgi:glycosyltransferase involved in cell wall biosynthesis